MLIEDEVVHEILLSLDELALFLLSLVVKLHETSADLFVDKHLVEWCQAPLVAELQGSDRVKEPQRVGGQSDDPGLRDSLLWCHLVWCH